MKRISRIILCALMVFSIFVNVSAGEDDKPRRNRVCDFFSAILGAPVAVFKKAPGAFLVGAALLFNPGAQASPLSVTVPLSDNKYGYTSLTCGDREENDPDALLRQCTEAAKMFKAMGERNLRERNL